MRCTVLTLSYIHLANAPLVPPCQLSHHPCMMPSNTLLILVIIPQLSHQIYSSAYRTFPYHNNNVNEELLYAGNWSYTSQDDKNGFPLCPITGINFNHLLSHHTSWLGGHKKGDYIPPLGIHLYTLQQSFNRILKVLSSPINITFIGDSLSLSKLYAAECMSELLSLQGKYEHIHTRWFIDNPCGCHTNHMNNTTAYIDNNSLRCSFNESFDTWVLNPETNIIVANNGAWFNIYWLSCLAEDGPNSVESTYERALILMKLFFIKCISKGIIVIWVGLPYSTTYKRPDYAYHKFQQRNQLARQIFKDTGVIVIDPFALVKKRITEDPRIKCDFLHFCGFSPSSIPVFEFRLIMHFAAHFF